VPSLGAVCIVAVFPIAGSLRGIGGPGPIDFGNGETLTALSDHTRAAVWVDTLAFLGPAMALPFAAAWFLMFRREGALAWFGVWLWSLGMIFTITQDAVQLAVVTKLPAAYSAADAAAKQALEAFGGSVAYVLSSVGGLIGFSGVGIMGVVMLRSRISPRRCPLRFFGNPLSRSSTADVRVP